MKNKIKVGYEVDSGKEITIPLSHMMVTGITQESGKTTTLESLAKRTNMRVVVFRTKGGEQSFLDGNRVKPFFKDRSDWQFIEGLIEATISEKVRAFERSMIIEICDKTNSLNGFKLEVDSILETERHNGRKIGNFQRSILINLQAYLKLVIPKLQDMKPTDRLVLSNGLNVIDLEKYDASSEVQSLIVKSVVEEILYTNNFMNTIVIIPESWKFIPQGKGNPAKFAIQKFIRQGAGTNRFLWIDSQDITGVDKETIKQVTNYLMGYQAEPNEVKKALSHMPLANEFKPKPDEIMNLGKGRFIVASRDLKTCVFVQAWWVSDENAKSVAKGEISISDLPEKPKIESNEISQEIPETLKEVDFSEDMVKVNAILESQNSKISDIEQTVQNYKENLPTIEKITSDTRLITMLAEQVVKKLPQSSGNVVYSISPLEKIKKDFILTAKDKIMTDISKLSDSAKQLLKYLESRNVGVTVNEICIKCFLFKQSGGGYSKQVNKFGSELCEIDVAEKQSNGSFTGTLMKRIKTLLQVHDSSEDEMNNLYNHIIMEILGEKNE